MTISLFQATDNKNQSQRYVQLLILLFTRLPMNM